MGLPFLLLLQINWLCIWSTLLQLAPKYTIWSPSRSPKEKRESADSFHLYPFSSKGPHAHLSSAGAFSIFFLFFSSLSLPSFSAAMPIYPFIYCYVNERERIGPREPVYNPQALFFFLVFYGAQLTLRTFSVLFIFFFRGNPSSVERQILRL